MASSTWDQSVERARLASLKTFEGRLEIAWASFEQIPPNGLGGTHDHTVADFAAEAGLTYDALDQYRSFATWWGDSAPLSGISYSLAREAKQSGRWKDGAALLTFVLQHDPPPSFKAWTVDALRSHLELEPTNTGKVQRIRETVAKLPAEERGAILRDLSTDREAQQAYDDLLRQEMTGPLDESGALAMGLMDMVNQPEFGDYVTSEAKATESLIEAINECRAWIERFPDAVIDGEHLPSLMRECLMAHRMEISAAYDLALDAEAIS